MLRLLLTSLVFWFLSVPAQNVDLNHIQRAKIGLVDEFIKRFNGVDTYPDSVFNRTDSRMNNLMLLFDLSKFSSRNDSTFVEASLMMERAIKDSVYLDYCDSTWFAIAHCKGSIEKKEVTFDLVLNVGHKHDSLYTWMISYASGDIFKIESHNNGKGMLYPDDHETNFISLMRMTQEQHFNIRQFLYDDFCYDMTSVFAYLIHSGQLKIRYVENLEFVFTQIPGYIFCIGNVERNTGNSGWLITRFNKFDNLDKAIIFKKLNIKNTLSNTVKLNL